MVLPVNEQVGVAPYAGLRVSRKVCTAAEWLTGADFDIFQITGGPIIIEYMFGHVTTLMGAGAAVPGFQHTPDVAIYVGTGQVDINLAAADISTDAVDTFLIWDGLNGDQLAPSTKVGIVDTTEYAWTGAGGGIILVEGMVNVDNGVSINAGVIDIYMLWRPQRSPAQVIAQ